MYLDGTWEVASPASAAQEASRPDGLARVATPEEIKENHWAHPPRTAIIVYKPQHPASRFRAHKSLKEGSQQWIGRYRRMGMQNPAFLKALNAGDTAAVAHELMLMGYYTTSEPAYARGMAAHKAVIDRMLGP
jgi:hypothetical protein